MKRVILSFCLGFIVATVIGLAVVIPYSRSMWQMNVGSDYCAPLRSIHAEIEATAAKEGAPRTLAQLRALNKQFTSFNVGGPTPHDWWPAIIAATQPATKPAVGPASRSSK